MKKTFTAMGALALSLALASPALASGAPSAQRSAQSLLVNGSQVKCEKYNIDGSNYFKLRDLACLLSGTGSQFGVGWDAASNTVTITTGKDYEYIGKETLLGADASATAQKSAQTILINGAPVSDISVYNIGGSNYFKLRDLGEALGFDVDYDADTNTAIVKSRAQQYLVVQRSETGISNHYFEDEDGNETVTKVSYTDNAFTSYDAKGNILTEERQYIEDGTESNSKDVYTYDENGNCLTCYTETDSSAYTTSYTYDAKGRVIEERRVFEGEEDAGEITTYAYNARGFVEKMTELRDGHTYETVYTYDAQNNQLSEIQTDDEGDRWISRYTYDANGNRLTSEDTTSFMDYSNTSTYTYNDAGQTLTEVNYIDFGDGQFSEYRTTYTYDDAGFVEKQTYSHKTNLSDETISSADEEIYTRDAAGRVLTDVTTYSDGTTSTYVYTYNDMGLCTKIVYTSAGDSRWNSVSEFTYDAEGNQLTERYVQDGETVDTTYTYDDADNLIERTGSDGSHMTQEFIRLGSAAGGR